MTQAKAPHATGVRILAFLAVAFGALTIKEGGTVLFGQDAARTAAGDYVPFVLWSNFLAGFAYMAAGVGLWLRRQWSWRLAAMIFTIAAVTFAAFVVHIAQGGAYEIRTVVAMSLRTLIWAFIALAGHRMLAPASARDNRGEG